ncbi:MAG: outer membrane protein assembly factor BamA [Rikenellaceae bacterium]
MRFLKLMAVALAAICTVQGFAQEGKDEPIEAQDSTVLQYSGAQILSGDTTPKQYLIRKVNVHGVETIDHNILRSSIGIIEGDSIYLPSNSIATAIQSLWSQRLYADVQMGATIDGQEVEIDIMLKERPRVFRWNFEGISKAKTTELNDEILKLRRNTELSEYVIDKNIKLIKQYFAEKGFLNTEVEVKIEDDPVRETMVNVTFVIDRKDRVKIEEIIFEGNEVFDDKRLRRTFKKTHQRSWNFFNSTRLKEKEFEADKEYLIDFYNANGYRNATILSDTVYDINEKRIGLRLKVSEGNKYYIRNVSWVGNSIYPTEQLEMMFGVSSGDTYDRKSMQKKLGIGAEANPDEMSISTLYQNEGYLMSMIEPAETIIGRDSIDIELKIYEGRPFTINEISIAGNITIDDEIVRREIYTHPGELYNRSLLMRTIQLLNAMGQFNPENIIPDIRPVSSSEVNIGYQLEEQSSNQINIAGGWGSGTFVGSAGITLNNISTENFFKKESWRPYPMGKNQTISLSAQTNGTYYKAASLSFIEPWLGGRKPNSLSVSMYYSDQNNAYYAYQTPTAYFRTLGVAAGLGRRLTWPDPYFTLYNEFSYERYSLLDWGTTFGMSDGTANMVSIKTVLARNSVDQQIYPRRGSNFSVSMELTPPISLLDGQDYTDDNLSDQDRYRWIEYHRWEMNADWYQTLSSNDKLVLMASADMGYLGYYNEDKISPFQRFEVGGDGMSGYSVYGVDVISLRGYEDGALDPSSSYSMGYNKYTVELRYPIVLQPSSQIYVLGFMEGGSGFSSWKDFSPFNIKRSAGVGVRLNLQVVGMLGIDWGYGFDPAVGESSPSGSQFHFVLGQQF